jgi:hypothetical protein
MKKMKEMKRMKRMKEMKKMKIYILLLLLIVSASGLQAQVSIGSEAEPAASAVLDLNSGGNGKRGLLLPRIALTSETDAETILSPATGLMVYADGTAGLAAGVYVWDGEKWKGATNEPEPCDVPAQPSVISGTTPVCASTTGLIYSVTNVNGVTYDWTTPAGWSITAGQGTNSITVTSGTEGGSISVTPSNDCGDGTARTLPVTISNKPATPGTITFTPAVANPLNLNGTFTASVAAVTNATSYTWVMPDGSGLEITSGTNTRTVTIKATTSGSKAMTGLTVKANNDCGSSTAKAGAGTLTVNDCTAAPAITAPTADQTIAAVNQNAVSPSLSVTATGNGGAVDYQWQKSTTGTGGWSNVTDGGTVATYSAPTTASGTVYYQCIVTNTCGSTTSKKFTVTVNDCSAAPTISDPTADAIIAVDRNAPSPSLSVTATGNGGAVDYQWQKSTTGTGGWSNVTGGGTAATYNAPTTASGTVYYQSIVTNTCGSTTSAKFTVTVSEFEYSSAGLDLVVGENTYKTWVFPGTLGRWMTSNSKEGTYEFDSYILPASAGYTPGPGERGYYYYPDQASSACPVGWHLPTVNEVGSLSVYLFGCENSNVRVEWFRESAGKKATRSSSNASRLWIGWDDLVSLFPVGAAYDENCDISKSLLSTDYPINHNGSGAPDSAATSVRCIED